MLVASLLAARAHASLDCHIGSYRLNDGSVIDIDSANDGLLRWRAGTPFRYEPMPALRASTTPQL